MLTKPGDCQPAGRRYHLTMSPREWATWTPAGILRYEERTDKSASFLEYIPFNLTFEYEHKRSLHKASIALFAHSIREHSLNWQLYTRSFDLRSDGHSNPTLPFAPEEAAKLTGVRPKSLSIALTIQPPKLVQVPFLQLGCQQATLRRSWKVETNVGARTPHALPSLTPSDGCSTG